MFPNVQRVYDQAWPSRWNRHSIQFFEAIDMEAFKAHSIRGLLKLARVRSHVSVSNGGVECSATVGMVSVGRLLVFIFSFTFTSPKDFHS